MSETNVQANEDSRLASTGVRRLMPDTTKIFEGAFSLLHCAVKGDSMHRGVFAVLMFPIRHPDRYISLRYTDEKDKIREIGVIEDLAAFPEETQILLRRILTKHYHEQIISRVYEVRLEFGLLFFEVETQRGRQEFMMPWRHDRAEDFGANGKVLLDAHDNRFIIPDVPALPPKDQRRFTSYIYW
jgi:hypothetical protein